MKIGPKHSLLGHPLLHDDRRYKYCVFHRHQGILHTSAIFRFELLKLF